MCVDFTNFPHLSFDHFVAYDVAECGVWVAPVRPPYHDVDPQAEPQTPHLTNEIELGGNGFNQPFLQELSHACHVGCQLTVFKLLDHHRKESYQCTEG